MNRTKLEIIYSVSILIIIPLLLVFNTIYLATNVRKDYDKELQSRAELSNTVLGLTLKDYLKFGQAELADEKLTELSETQNELINTTLLTKVNDEYVVYATTIDDFEISNTDKTQYDISYSRQRAVAKSVTAYTNDGQETRVWSVATPIIENEKVLGIVTSELLTVDVDEKFDATIFRSMWIMAVSTIIVLALLINHFRYIGYVGLLQKQRELNQTMNDFLSVATHELKAPMTIIKGYIANVIDGDFGEIPESAKEQLNTASSQTERLNELVLDLLNVSHIEQGKIEINMAPVNISEVLRMIINQYQPIAQQKGLNINYSSEGDVWVAADKGRVQEIFTNLVDNAVKYSKQGEITILHKLDGKYVITSVRDTGIGMTSEERARLFQRFYRVKNDKTKNINGTGLGLWIIKQYIEKMDGKINVDSLENSGSEFRVSLKKSDPQA